MPLLRLLLQRSAWTLAASIIAGALAGAANIAMLALIRNSLVDSETRRGTLIAGFLALCFLRLLSGVAAQASLIRLAQRAILDLRLHLCRRILDAPLQQMEQLGSHRIFATLTEDVARLAGAYVEIPFLCIRVGIVVSSLVYLAYLSLTSLVILLAFLVFGGLSYRSIQNHAMIHLRLARQEEDELYRAFRALTEGQTELKLNAARREEFQRRALHASAESLARRMITGSTVYAAAANWGQLLFALCIAGIVFGIPTITRTRPSELIGQVLVLLYMMSPLEAIFAVLPNIAFAAVSLRHIQEMGVTLEPERAPCADKLLTPHDPKAIAKRLVLEGITHRYIGSVSGDGFHLGPIDLIVQPGELVFLVGGNGSGKTTLAKIIAGLYLPERGRILFDDAAVGLEDLAQYRARFAAVFSNFYLFEQLFGICPEVTEHRVTDYLAALGLSHSVSIVNGGFSTTALSTGQRKRLALLVALLEQRPFYIFDEWTAEQDPPFKIFFYEKILPDLKSQGRTVFVITHDDRYFHVADRIVKMDRGTISEIRCARRPKIAELQETCVGKGPP